MEILAHLSLGGGGGSVATPLPGGLLGLILDRFRGRDPPSLEPKKVHLVGSPPPSPYSPRLYTGGAKIRLVGRMERWLSA